MVTVTAFALVLLRAGTIVIAFIHCSAVVNPGVTVIV